MPPCQCCLLGLKPGIAGSIRHFGAIDPMLKRRLADLGVAEGSNVTIKRRCPLGGPIMLECCGQLLGIRKKEAAQIEVDVS
ncbi:ferrous iron transport protein A [Fontibacillus solani]|uniref:Ferrous iron transport protein A n=1 Tax=Fontibacillus solani TaxID=1572857 RepID=A0A7W3SS28_9BACL|nr:FeoA family protein [Fontibacillus solani]MBA9084998.1 ferrous iron transport protein A [Fontibacillus solani]